MPMAMVAAWALSRAVLVVVATTSLSRGRLFNDPNLLWAWANGVAFGDDEAPALDEYPGLARVLASTARMADTPTTFGWAWIAAMLSVDLLILVLLRRRRQAAGWFWVAGGALLGPVLWLRLDLVVALLALVAVAWRDRRPAWAGVALAAAVLLKLWPVVLVPALLLRRDTRRWAVAAGSTLGIGLALEVLVRGPSSVLTPLTYQAERGWQIESLWATPSLVAQRGADPTTVWEFSFRAYQLQGSGAPVTLLVAALVLGLAALGVLLVTRDAPSESLRLVRADGAALLTVLVLAANTVFSPQYVMWLLPLVGLVVARSRTTPWPLVATSLTVAALTQLIWPWGYNGLLELDDRMLVVLVLRNLAVLALGVLLAVRLAEAWGSRRSRVMPAGTTA